METTTDNTYKSLLQSAESLFTKEDHFVSVLSNASALLYERLKPWWVGFYLVNPNDPKKLFLGPFQGPLACTEIPLGKGVCGTAWAEKKTLIVPDVHQFEGHIACSAESNSEIVVPLFHKNDVVGVLDIDSKEFDTFSELDRKHLESFCEIVGSFYKEI